MIVVLLPNHLKSHLKIFSPFYFVMGLVKIFVSWPIRIFNIILTLKKVKCMKSFLIALAYEVDTKLQSTR